MDQRYYRIMPCVIFFSITRTTKVLTVRKKSILFTLSPPLVKAKLPMFKLNIDAIYNMENNINVIFVLSIHTKQMHQALPKFEPQDK